MQPFSAKTLPEDWDRFYSEQTQSELTDCLQAFYVQPPADSNQTLQSTEFVAVDIETTGMDAQQDDIISIGLVPFDSQCIHLAQAQHWLVRTRQLTSDSIIVHHITHSEVANAPTLRSVLPEVMACLAGKQVVVHYRPMEREFFRQAAMSLYGENWLFPVIDTMEQEARYIKQKQSLLAKTLRKRLPSARLPNARQRYHLPAYENHNALVDALATAELWQAQIAHWEIEATRVRKWWC